MSANASSVFRSLHLQVMGMQAVLASMDHTLREVLGADGKTDAVSPPPKVAAVSEELRSILGKPTLEETRKNVFMPKTASTPASGTPSGDTPSVPSD